MKKRILLLVLALVVVLSGCMPSFLQEPAQPKALTQPGAIPVLENPAEKTPPEPPVEEEPEIVVEFRESWTPLLAGRTMTARHYFVYDFSTNSYLILSGESTETLFPASVTKLFSAHVALKYLDPEEILTAGDELELIPDDASVAGLEEGDSMRVAQLIEGMLLPSGNDATYVLATTIGRRLADDPSLAPQAAIDRFVEQMNAHARVLGLTGTHFVTPDGMHHENHYTCPQDLVTIGLLAMRNPLIAQYAAVISESIVMDEERTLEWKNTNILLNPESDFYCPYTVGLKTGFTTPAGNCMLTAFRVGDRELLIGIFGCEDPYDRYAEVLLQFALAFDLDIPEPPPEEEPTEEEPTDSVSIEEEIPTEVPEPTE